MRQGWGHGRAAGRVGGRMTGGAWPGQGQPAGLEGRMVGARGTKGQGQGFAAHLGHALEWESTAGRQRGRLRALSEDGFGDGMGVGLGAWKVLAHAAAWGTTGRSVRIGLGHGHGQRTSACFRLEPNRARATQGPHAANCHTGETTSPPYDSLPHGPAGPSPAASFCAPRRLLEVGATPPSTHTPPPPPAPTTPHALIV